MIIFFRKPLRSMHFLKFELKKKLSLTENNYHVSFFLKKKIQFQRFWDQRKNRKKCEKATICNAEVKLNCNF